MIENRNKVMSAKSRTGALQKTVEEDDQIQDEVEEEIPEDDDFENSI